MLVALMCTTALLVVLGWVAAGRAGMAGVRRLLVAGAAGIAGLAMVALKLALH